MLSNRHYTAPKLEVASSAFLGMNNLLGVFGAPDPVSSLRRLGVEPTWSDSMVAFGGAPVWTDSVRGIVVSGELVLDNADELRQELALPEADSGLLLAELYCRHGAMAGQYALGMFAVAIWDIQRQSLVLLRDGVGARTLYYAKNEHECWFAARLRSLRRCPIISGIISLTALRKYLTFSFVPGSETFWQDILELRPGTALAIPGGNTHSYWEPTESFWDPFESLEVYAARLRALLETAVRDRLPSSGPVGVYLSGGVDSSLVTALVARFHAGPIHTYAIHFGHEHPNELAFSGLVAEHCGTHHHILGFSGQQIYEKLEETIRLLDDPIGDPLTVPNLLLGQAAVLDTNIILNGEGGDPCFGGPKNLPMLLHEIYTPESDRRIAYLRSYRRCYDDLPLLLTPEVQTQLLRAEPQEATLTPFFSNPHMSHYLNKLMHMNVRLKGADHILTKVNNLTTANRLLGRSPLFDKRIVEASFATPPIYKLSGTKEKAVLKSAVADLLPDIIVQRPKSGMRVPVQSWFKYELNRFAHGMLLNRTSRIRPYINQNLIREWLSYRGNLWPRHGSKLWLLLTLEVWLRGQED